MATTDGAPVGHVRVTEYRTGTRIDREDEAAVEEPLEIRVLPADLRESSSIPIAVTLRTPGSDFELAAGFLVSEGLLRGPEDVVRITYCTPPDEPQQFNTVNVELAPNVPFDRERFRRNVYTSSSCGVCGKASLDQVRATVPGRPVGRFRVSPGMVENLPAQLASAQRLFGRTGGLHAAALFRPTGELRLLREDVGRHNAVDKLVGNRFLDRSLPESNTILLVSGRAGFELVQKAAVAGIPFLAAIGAPSTLAVELAAEQGMTLVGFLREGRFNVYSGGERVGE